LPLYKRHRVIESVLNGVFRAYKKPTAVVHLEHKLTGPKKKKKEEEEEELL